ncbi:hypothetical protein E2C01_055718 [Portunus trituberculatus]|uniref:SAP domain-containing protein n=1 Tax=Portunus trituberculatus TaxID=210409 RepID=A0A5B7GYG6_PORTR|nr:hypothetical protein [Portunus trituberculatus]
MPVSLDDLMKLRVVDLKAKLATFNLPTHGKCRHCCCCCRR